MEKGEAGTATVYAAASVLLSIAGCFAGLWFARSILA
jgi:fluoride ion exporter CrcB/FEX